MPLTLRTRYELDGKEVLVAKVKALIDFAGSTINRDELGLVKTGTEIEVSANDAAYLEREGYAERVNDEPAVAATGATEPETSTAKGKSSSNKGKES